MVPSLKEGDLGWRQQYLALNKGFSILSIKHKKLGPGKTGGINSMNNK